MPSSPRSSITRISSTLAIGFVAAALAACSGTGDALGEPAEANDDVVVQQEQPQQDDGANPGDSDVDDDGVAGAADDADGGNAIILPARTIDATVYVGGLEYTIGEVRVLDLDDEAGRLPQRTHGLQVDIDVEAFNPTDSQSMVNLMATLSWVDPESGLLHQGFGSPPQGAGVPGGGRANLALEYQVDGMEVDTFSLESAALRFGNEGQHAAVVPLGDEGELNSKFPHFQEQMVGVTVELEDVSWTIDEAFIGYNHGNSRLGDDQVLLEIAYTFANDSEHQQCHYRGRAKLRAPAHRHGHRDDGPRHRALRQKRCPGAVAHGLLVTVRRVHRHLDADGQPGLPGRPGKHAGPECAGGGGGHRQPALDCGVAHQVKWGAGHCCLDPMMSSNGTAGRSSSAIRAA